MLAAALAALSGAGPDDAAEAKAFLAKTGVRPPLSVQSIERLPDLAGYAATIATGQGTYLAIVSTDGAVVRVSRTYPAPVQSREGQSKPANDVSRHEEWLARAGHGSQSKQLVLARDVPAGRVAFFASLVHGRRVFMGTQMAGYTLALDSKGRLISFTWNRFRGPAGPKTAPVFAEAQVFKRGRTLFEQGLSKGMSVVRYDPLGPAELLYHAENPAEPLRLAWYGTVRIEIRIEGRGSRSGVQAVLLDATNGKQIPIGTGFSDPKSRFR